MFHVGYTVQGVWNLLRRHGWSAQMPVRRALERDDEAIEVGKAEVWPQVKNRGPLGRPHLLRGRDRPGAEAAEGTHLGTSTAAGGTGTRPQPGRFNIAGVVCYRAGHRPRFLCKLHIWHGLRGEAFTWRQYRDLIVMTHLQLSTPVVRCWDNLNVHQVKELVNFAARHKDWSLIFQMPSYAPELNPAEGIWSLLKRHLADFAAADLAHLIHVIKRELKKIQYRSHLLDGCLPPTTGLIMDGDVIRSPDSASST
jgi:hypothetical protein